MSLLSNRVRGRRRSRIIIISSSIYCWYCCWWWTGVVMALKDTATDNNNVDTAATCLDDATNDEYTTSSDNNNGPANDDDDDGYRDPRILQCGVYMAPSTLGDASHLGIFTAQPLKANDEVINFPELVIPLAFREWGINPPSAEGDGELWDRYLWSGDTVDDDDDVDETSTSNMESFDTYDRTQKKSVLVPGVGCTINSALDLHTVRSTRGSEYDVSGVERSHPAAGSFSPYHSSKTITSTKDKTKKTFIPAGAELFGSYGETWIPWIPGIPVLQNSNLESANALLNDFAQWTTEMKEKHAFLADELSVLLLFDRLYQLTRNFPHQSSKVFSVLPPTYQDWKNIVLENENNEPNDNNTDWTRTYWRSQHRVSVEWLQTSHQAKCQDHIRPGRSTIPHAGKGAFATRFLPKGTVVGYAPLIHVAYAFDNMTQVRTSSSSSSMTTTMDGDSKQQGQQHQYHPDLIWNYSFGHPNSTLVLTPYGAMVNYINHSPSVGDNDDDAKANVRVQWPQQELIAHKPEWLHKDLDFLRYSTKGVGLSFDYIALRDIQPGEELFMDYGQEWQAAWDDHVANWKVPDDADRYVHSSQYPMDSLKTLAELQEDPYPPNLVTVCAESFRSQDDRYVFVPILRDWKIYVPCDVVGRSSGNRYTVRLFTTTGTAGGGETKTITVYNVPYPEGKGILLVDRAYSQDWHLPNAFRHKLMIPDDIFPSAWRNLG